MLPKTSQPVPLLTITTGFDTDQPNILLLDKVVERSDSVTSTSDTGDDGVRKLADLLGHLLLDLPSDDSLEITDDGGERVRTDGGSDTVVGRLQVGHPFAHGLVDGVLERLGAGSDGDDLERACKHPDISFGSEIRRIRRRRLTFPPNILILNTFNACLLTSSAPM
jgi:hypothetical protein